jgi:hypothetical protein
MIARIALFVVIAFVAGAPRTVSAEAPLRLNEHTLSEVRSLASLPADVATALRRPYAGHYGMADRGEPFNVTDVADPNLSMRRFIVGGVSDDYVVVGFEVGGRGHALATIAFTRVNSKWNETPTRYLTWRYGVPVTLADLLRMIREPPQ